MLDGKVNVVWVRSVVRGHLEDLVLGDKMSLDKAKEIARMANKLLITGIESWQELLERIKKLEREYPDLKRLWEMLIFEVKLENQKRLVDEQVLPKIEQGDLNGALVLINELIG